MQMHIAMHEKLLKTPLSKKCNLPQLNLIALAYLMGAEDTDVFMLWLNSSS